MAMDAPLTVAFAEDARIWEVARDGRGPRICGLRDLRGYVMIRVNSLITSMVECGSGRARR